jgi:hypothetical protein
MTDPAVRAALREAADALGDVPGVPADLVEAYLPRHEFELGLICGLKGTNIRLWDLGGGLGVFVAAAAVLGMRPTIVDDFLELRKMGVADSVLPRLSSLGVRVIEHDFDTGVVSLEHDLDVVTSFHTIEHLHRSPRQQYRRIVECLAPNGLFIIAGPNAVNLRKRLTAPFGGLEWSSMQHWYYEPVFRAHVREPRTQDLLEIAKDLGLSGRIIGKNFLGARRPGLVGTLARLGGPVLERSPSLCSDLYLIAAKGAYDGVGVSDGSHGREVGV